MGTDLFFYYFSQRRKTEGIHIIIEYPELEEICRDHRNSHLGPAEEHSKNHTTDFLKSKYLGFRIMLALTRTLRNPETLKK